MTKKYYAEHCLYGVNTSYDSFNRQAYSFFVFDSKKERDKGDKLNENSKTL